MRTVDRTLFRFLAALGVLEATALAWVVWRLWS